MIVKRNKQFSLWNRFTAWIDKRNKNKETLPELIKKEEPLASKTKNGQSFTKPKGPIIKEGTFEDVYRECAFMGPNPHLITIGLNRLENEAMVKDFESLIKGVGLIQSSGRIESVTYINDNIKGKNGATVQLITFSPNTDINTGVRLSYSDRMKWVDDFLYGNDYWTWFKSGENCANIPIHRAYESMPNRNRF